MSAPPIPRRAALQALLGWPAAIAGLGAAGLAAVAFALRRLRRPRGVPVTAFKGYLGNLVSGAGAVEMIASLQAVQRGKVPAILNCEHPDPECEADLILKAPRPCRNPIFVNTNVTPLGQAAALVVRGWPAAANPAAK